MFLNALSEFAMPLKDALVLSLLGMAIVFAVLILLMFIIMIMGKIMAKSPALAAKMPKLPKFKDIFKKKGTETPDEATVVEEPKAKGTCGELVLINTDERDAAMIMAIVADTTGIPLNQLRFKSIKRIDE